MGLLYRKFQDGKKFPEVSDEEIFSYMPGLSAYKNNEYIVKPDTTFTRDATGLGSIEYMPPERDTVRYPNGYKLPHPAYGKHAIIYNPKDNDVRDVTMDMLHGLPAIDSTYAKLRDTFEKTRMNEDTKKWLYQRWESEGKPDSFEGYIDNFIDGEIRASVFEGTDEDFKKHNYNRETGERYRNGYFSDVMNPILEYLFKKRPEKM